MTKTPAKPAPPVKKTKPATVDADNPFVLIRKTLATIFDGTVGKLPTPLVMILVMSLLAAVLAGLALKMVEKPKTNVPFEEKFLPVRLTPDAGAPELTKAALEGVWVTPKGELSMTVRFTKAGLFEWIIQPPDTKYLRQYVRGNYRIAGNVLILGQRPDLGKPPAPTVEVVEYLAIKMKNLNARVGINPKVMVWQVPPSELALQNDVVSGLFPADGTKPLTWVKIQ